MLGGVKPFRFFSHRVRASHGCTLINPRKDLHTMFSAFRRLGAQAKTAPRSVRLSIESLEQREVPANFLVTNLNDAGAGSLRQAVIDANGVGTNDVIQFQAGLTGTITLTSGQLTVTDDVDIQGPGAAVISVSGNNASRIFNIDDGNAANVAVSISGLTL